jgi:hypothetical protein
LPAAYHLSNTYTGTASASCPVTPTGATRTIGFWKTHLQYTKHILDKHTLFGQSGPLGLDASGHFINGKINLGWVKLSSYQDVMGILWADNSKDSTGKKRSAMCQACVIASKQLVGAILNSGLSNASPPPTADMNALIAALAAHNDKNLILSLGAKLDTYNSSGDGTVLIDSDGTLVAKASPKDAEAAANIKIADCPF